ncbi:hypothetical protein CO180_00575 [candidate division WWE3 bacterium CG_4_9_14_3_um_filter_41_6]|uniref:Uncharacterized protein n=1 Tax=candidate division WWE3 bacterium CG_4_10_14_0_2_um_filter_41_14 TaxID=1975072 RepID=A0A2M7TJW6_UNCKA|nr:MAG: hypothetical protein COY32_02515 [candidate division WWE3 bacterium CG_4_10_14_0_2_um_filter_41_14]PJA39484.1 MAG: hypothetical protein CO180_00575 [candidate division WWE3 bacterium CG_4_9_14_3_um_filter_41_6]
MELKIDKSKNGKIEIHVAATVSDVAHGKEHALNEFAPYVEITGFRKGKAPHNLVEKNVKEEKLIEEIITHLAQDAYEQAITEQSLQPITEPHVAVDELKESKDGLAAPDLWESMQKDGLNLTITSFITPEVELGKWEEAVRKVEKPKKEEKKQAPVLETATSIEDARIEDAKQKATPEKNEAENAVAKTSKQQKEEQDDREFEDKILDALIAQATIEVADELVTGEAQQMIMQQIQVVQQLGINYEEFMKSQGKTIEDVEKETKEVAKRTITGRFILSELAKKYDKELEGNPTFQQVLAFIYEKATSK